VPEHITLGDAAVGFVRPLNFLGEGTELLGVGPRAVEELATLLMSSPEVHLRVIGHTSNRGDAGELQKLSLARAQAVVDILVATGVDAQRLEAVGRGGEAPVATNRTRSGRKKNQRIELELASGAFKGFDTQQTVN
jgi:outer membrane protein OmpA-like peptidoglycan-associated protein